MNLYENIIILTSSRKMVSSIVFQHQEFPEIIAKYVVKYYEAKMNMDNEILMNEVLHLKDQISLFGYSWEKNSIGLPM